MLCKTDSGVGSKVNMEIIKGTLELSEVSKGAVRTVSFSIVRRQAERDFLAMVNVMWRKSDIWQMTRWTLHYVDSRVVHFCIITVLNILYYINGHKPTFEKVYISLWLSQTCSPCLQSNQRICVFFWFDFQYVGINIPISTSYNNFALSNFLGYNISSSVLEKLCQTSSLRIQTWKKYHDGDIPIGNWDAKNFIIHCSVA